MLCRWTRHPGAESMEENVVLTERAGSPSRELPRARSKDKQGWDCEEPKQLWGWGLSRDGFVSVVGVTVPIQVSLSVWNWGPAV